jgi:drug/metabolite transporter (DMT)-like permease
MNQSWLGYLLSGGALLCFTTAILTTKKASALMPLRLGFLVATATNVVFSALALIAQRASQPMQWEWNQSAFWYFVASGVLATYLGRWFFYESVVRFGPAKASVFQVSSPLFTALIAWIFLGESLAISVVFAMSMAIMGLLIIGTKPLERHLGPSIAKPSEQLDLHSESRAEKRLISKLMGSVLFLGLGSSLAYGLGNVLRGAAIRDWNEPILGGVLGATSGLAMYMFFSSKKKEIVEQLRNTPRQGVWLFILIGAATISGQILTIGAMRFIPVSVATLVTLCTPLLVIPLSRVLYKSSEKISLDLILGTGLTLVGIFGVVIR